eukprot:CAMPEP_0201492990 /NCGR_PEP_ID=MMETSP0151_2-20130828/35661_1 /ASSEMBLY_ACC=CAM_ASM_000257 /TAXON_ID=200890 /ORGANISM="Paramoeba atlantica, Strain 621/1 / CCAP 1560/9" /LENGTH=36 /DNA_ID= /DNA_START= /DNA_END= /DNA_ORIENTATION=
MVHETKIIAPLMNLILNRIGAGDGDGEGKGEGEGKG